MNLNELMKSKTIPIKRREVGIAGAVIVIAQFISTFQSSQSVTNEIAKLREEFQQLRIDREQYFSRKTDLIPILTKLDKMNEKLIELNEKLASLKDEVRENRKSFEANLYGAEGGDLVGCSATIVPALQVSGIRL